MIKCIVNNLTEVIGGTAVMPEWNGFTKVFEYTVPSGGIKVWKGKAAAQPISQLPQLQSNTHMLAGGEYQIFINDILRNQAFEDAIENVTLTYKKW
ncbi:MAG: hypothetical protein ACK504_02925 [Bacteroidota bacterium]